MTLLGISDIMLDNFNAKILIISPLLICVLAFILPSQLVYAENEKNKELELALLSPAGAVTRSFLIPGWGQIYTGKKILGTTTFISTLGLASGGLIARERFLRVYNNEYRPRAKAEPDSKEARSYYDKANQRYKTSRALFISAIGVWVYGVVDSYVNANVYNAKLKSDKLFKDLEEIRNLKVSMKLKQAEISEISEIENDSSQTLFLYISLRF